MQTESMIKLFSLKNQQSETSRGGGVKRASAAQLRIQKGILLFYSSDLNYSLVVYFSLGFDMIFLGKTVGLIKYKIFVGLLALTVRVSAIRAIRV